MESEHVKESIALIEAESRKETIRFITCGSVDDGIRKRKRLRKNTSLAVLIHQ